MGLVSRARPVLRPRSPAYGRARAVRAGGTPEDLAAVSRPTPGPGPHSTARS